MTRVTLIKVSYTLYVIITKIIPNVSSRNYVKETIKNKENLNPHTNINVQTNTINKQTITNYKPLLH